MGFHGAMAVIAVHGNAMIFHGTDWYVGNNVMAFPGTCHMAVAREAVRRCNRSATAVLRHTTQWQCSLTVSWQYHGGQYGCNAWEFMDTAVPQ